MQPERFVQPGYDLPLCSHFQGITERERYIRQFGAEPPGDLGKYDLKSECTPSLKRVSLVVTCTEPSCVGK